MPDPSVPALPAVTDYRLAPAFAARLLGLGLVVVAAVVLVVAGLSLALDWSPDVTVAVGGLGVVLVVAAAAWLRSRAYVVRFTTTGYAVRFVRGVGVGEGRWDEVAEAATAHPHGIACLVLTRHDGRTTSIPVETLAADRERLADDVRRRLDHAAGRG